MKLILDTPNIDGFYKHFESSAKTHNCETANKTKSNFGNRITFEVKVYLDRTIVK